MTPSNASIGMSIGPDGRPTEECSIVVQILSFDCLGELCLMKNKFKKFFFDNQIFTKQSEWTKVEKVITALNDQFRLLCESQPCGHIKTSTVFYKSSYKTSKNNNFSKLEKSIASNPSNPPQAPTPKPATLLEAPYIDNLISFFSHKNPKSPKKKWSNLLHKPNSDHQKTLKISHKNSKIFAEKFLVLMKFSRFAKILEVEIRRAFGGGGGSKGSEVGIL